MNCLRKQNTIYFHKLNHPKVVSEFLYELQSGLNAGYSEFGFDFKEVDLIFPNAVVPISGILEYYRKENNLEFLDFDLPYAIENCGLFNPYTIESLVDPVDEPLNKVWKFNQFEHVFLLVNSYIDELSKIDQFTEGVLNGIEWSLNEVMDNVLQHSDTSYGFVMGQIHRNSNHIAFCIFDSGRGIFNSLKNSNYRPKSPIDALTLCIKEGVTRDKKIGQGNGMYGLSEIVKSNNGALTIVSNKVSMHLNAKDVKFFKNLPTISFQKGCTTIDFQLDYNNSIDLDSILKKNLSSSGFVNYRLEDLENDAGEIEYVIYEKAKGFGTRKSGLKVRNEIINIHTETKRPINLDFKGVNLVSSSFADELVGKLVIHYGFIGFNNIIRLRNMNDLVQTIVQRSVSQRIIENNNPT